MVVREDGGITLEIREIPASNSTCVSVITIGGDRSLKQS
jgi:hypothetical protein